MKNSNSFTYQLVKEFAHLKLKCFVLATTLLLIYVLPAYAMRDIPDDNLSYPVSINLNDGGTGSGFYLNTDKYTFLVTAKHVLYKSDKDKKTGVEQLSLRSQTATLLSYPKDPQDEGVTFLS